MLRRIAIILALCLPAFAQNWSSIIDPSRAINWTANAPGVTGGIPTGRTQCGGTIAAYSGTAATINTAIAGCAANHFVLLGAGTFNLSTGIDFANHSNVTLRGSGPDSTFLIFTNFAGCGGFSFSATICVENATNAYPGNPLGHVANWTANYSSGTSALTFDFSDGTLTAGNILILDVCNTGYTGAPCTGSSSDNGQLFLCDTTPGAGNTAPPGCSTEGGEGITRAFRGEGQIVKVVSVSGAGPYTVNVTPAVYLPNVAGGLSPQGWWTGGTVTGVGIENLSIDATNSGGQNNITFFDAADSWVKNVRSLNSARAHVLMLDAAHITIRDSYFFGTQNAASQSYGFETDVTSDSLFENNIFQHVTSPMPQGKLATGNVYDYNFAINDFYTVTPQWMQGSGYHHAEGLLFNLFEGNDGSGFQADIIHGTGAFGTFFRNRYHGWEACAGTPSCSGGKNLLTEAFNIATYVRYYNMIGNVLGQTSYHTGYECFPSGPTGSCGSFNAGNLAVYELGFSNWNGECINCGGAGTIPNDTFVRNSLFRWGNYDIVNNSNQFNNSEVPTGISPFANAIPASHTLPSSFFYSSTPNAWWGFVSGTQSPFPPYGPDVVSGTIGRCSGGTYDKVAALTNAQCTGGTLVADLGGRANPNPAMNCALNIMSMPPDGSGSALTFNANSCYTNLSASPATNYSPASVPFGNQTVSTTSGAQTVTLTNVGTANLVTTAITLTGANPADFAISGGTCNPAGQTIAAAGSCTVTVTFTPASAASFTAFLTFASNASTSPDNIPLSGTGVTPTPSYSPAPPIAFGNQTVLTTSSPQTVTLTNTGLGNLITTGITLTGTNPTDFAISGGTCNPAGQTIAPSGSCTVTVTFTPASAASFTANLHFVSNAATSPNNIALTGTGVAPSQAATPVLSPSSGIVPQVVTATSASGGTITECWAASPTVPVTNGLGTGCTVGTQLANGGTIVMSTPITLNVVAGTSTLTDSLVATGTYTGATLGAYQPLAIAWQAPQPSDTTNFNNFVLNVLPHLSGIGVSSTTATGNNLGNVYWSDVDNCSTTAPCATEANYAWPDSFIMSYVNATVGSNGTFANGCAGGTRCVIIMGIAPQQDSGTGVTKTPTYVMSHTYAQSLGAADQDVSFATAWPGAVSGTWPGTVPCTNINTGNDACVANATNGCTAYGSATCGTVHGPPDAAQNLSGFPVVYEIPIMTAYQKMLTALFLHYSASGTSPGPTIAPYLQAGYVRIGLAAGAENNPGNVGSGAVTNGILAHTFWPGPKGLALEPAGFSQCGYLTNWLGSAQNGIAGCSALPNDGDGYVTAMDKFFASLNTNGIRISQSAHGGPPSNSNTFGGPPINTNAIAPYADAESLLASIYGQPSATFAGAGFGMQSARLADIASYGAGPLTNPCTQNWCLDFQRFGAPIHHLVGINDGAAAPHAAEFGITSCSGSSGTITCVCSGTNGTACEIFNVGSTVFIANNSNANYNGMQVVTGTNPNQIQFANNDNSGGSSGQLFSPSYLPLLMPFITQRHATSLEIWECELDYAYGTTTSNVACQGNPGPDTSFQNAILNFENGTPVSTSAIKGTAACKGKCSNF